MAVGPPSTGQCPKTARRQISPDDYLARVSPPIWLFIIEEIDGYPNSTG